MTIWSRETIITRFSMLSQWNVRKKENLIFFDDIDIGDLRQLNHLLDRFLVLMEELDC